MKHLFLFITLGLLFPISCGNNGTPSVSRIDALIEISHFDHHFFAMDSAQLDQDLVLLKNEFPSFFEIGQKDEQLKQRFYDLQIRDLYASVDSIYNSTEFLDLELSNAFQYFYHYFPTHDSLKIYTWISNFENLEPVIVSGSTLLIGLDMYLGSESHFYKTAPEYIKQGFDKRFISSDVFHSYFANNISMLTNNSLLASMVHYGKIHYLSSLMLPDAEPEIIMGYSRNKMDWCFSNEANIWAYFIENKLLFSSQYQDKQRFIENAPFSKFYTSFDSESPGSVGQWIGWRLVSSYMNSHPEISLSDLIKEQDAQKILRESRYKPKQ